MLGWPEYDEAKTAAIKREVHISPKLKYVSSYLFPDCCEAAQR